MDFIKNLLGKLTPSYRQSIGINISTTSKIEVVEYDYDLGEIKNYFKSDFPYDNVLREINAENLEQILQTALKRFDVNSQTLFSIVLPNLLISSKSLPSELGTEEISTALTSETEKYYIFKKSEPKVSWNIISTDTATQTHNIIFSAIQKVLAERIEDVFNRMGYKLYSVESSYTAYLRGLSASGLVDDNIEKNTEWVVFIVKNNVNIVATLKGGELKSITETPLALTSVEQEEIYPTVASSLLEKMQDTNPSTVLLVNQTGIIDSNELKNSLGLNAEFVFVENNKFKGEPIFYYSLDPDREPVSPEAIGASCGKNAPVKFLFNFSSIRIHESSNIFTNFGFTGNPIHIVLLGLIAVSFVLIMTISLIAMPINATIEEKYKTAAAECLKYQEKFSKPQVKVFNLYNVVKSGFENNEKLITSYDSISAVIPEKVWVTSVSIDNGLNAAIKGRAYSVEDVIRYYQNLISVAKFQNFKIKSIQAVGEGTSASFGQSGVSIKPMGEGMPADASLPSSPPDNIPGELPPPPSASSEPASASSESPMASIPVAAGQKYYEFEFGEPAAKTVTDANGQHSATGQQKGNQFMPDLNKLKEGFNLNKSKYSQESNQ